MCMSILKLVKNHYVVKEQGVLSFIIDNLKIIYPLAAWPEVK